MTSSKVRESPQFVHADSDARDVSNWVLAVEDKVRAIATARCPRTNQASRFARQPALCWPTSQTLPSLSPVHDRLCAELRTLRRSSGKPSHAVTRRTLASARVPKSCLCSLGSDGTHMRAPAAPDRPVRDPREASTSGYSDLRIVGI
jgi:hypothetical protein